MPAESYVLNVCLTGMVPTRAMNPNVPMTPCEISRDVEACCELGASIFHLHARDEKGEPDWRRERYQAIVQAVRDVTPDAVICFSTSGRRVGDVERRTACLETDPPPDMASLTLGSINFLRDATLNAPDTVAGLLETMTRRGVKPELEIFDVGMARTAARLVADGALSTPCYANVLLGNAASADASPLDLATIFDKLPDGVVRCTAGIGKAQLAANTLGLLFGDGVRVGLEDNLYLDARKTPATNPALVERVVRLGEILGRTPASICETRERLGL